MPSSRWLYPHFADAQIALPSWFAPHRRFRYNAPARTATRLVAPALSREELSPKATLYMEVWAWTLSKSPAAIASRQRRHQRLKNAALPIMAASILTEGETILRGVPQLEDIKHLTFLLKARRQRLAATKRGGWSPSQSRRRDELPRQEYELVRKMRASVCVSWARSSPAPPSPGQPPRRLQHRRPPRRPPPPGHARPLVPKSNFVSGDILSESKRLKGRRNLPRRPVLASNRPRHGQRS